MSKTRLSRPTPARQSFVVTGRHVTRKTSHEETTTEFTAAAHGTHGLILAYLTFIGAAVVLLLLHLGPPGLSR